MGMWRYDLNITHSNYTLQVQDHNKTILIIINSHFDIAEERVDEVYCHHFSDTKTVFSRHWRHKKDIPYDLVSPLNMRMILSQKKFHQTKKFTNFIDPANHGSWNKYFLSSYTAASCTAASDLIVCGTPHQRVC